MPGIRLRHRLLFALLGTAIASMAGAQGDEASPAHDPAHPIDTSTADADGTTPVLDSVPVAATVDGQAPIAATVDRRTQAGSAWAAADYAALLQSIPGVHAQSRGNFAQDAQLALRGHGARSSFGVRGVRLVVDGIPVSSADGQGQLGQFDPWLLARAEVIRGPFAVLHGNASGGVIRLHRRQLDGGLVSLQWGEDQQAVRALRSFENEIADALQLAASHWRGRGARPHSDAQRSTVDAFLSRTTAGGDEIAWQFSAASMPRAEDPLGLTAQQFFDDPFMASPLALQFDTRKSVDQAQLGLHWRRHEGSRIRRAALWLGRRGIEQFLAVPVAAQRSPQSGGGVIDLSRTQAGAEWTEAFESTHWRASAGVRAEAQRDDRLGFENFRGDILGVRGALRRDERLQVDSLDPMAMLEAWNDHGLGGFLGTRHSRVRFDVRDTYIRDGNPDDSGQRHFSAWSTAAGASWRRGNWLFKGSVGRGFETPTGNELAYRADGSSGLNLALDAARSRLREWAVGYAGTRGNVEMLRFDEHVRDEIVVLQTQGGRSVFGNTAATRRRGWELAAQWRPAPSLQLALAHSWLDARYRGGALDGFRLPGIPTRWGEVTLDWQWRDTQALQLRVYRSSGVFANDRNTLRTQPWTRTDLIWSRSLPSRFGRLELSAGLHNLFDRRYVGSVIVNEANGRSLETAAGRSLEVALSLASDY